MNEETYPATENIKYYRGDVKRFVYTIENTNLTGATLVAQVRTSVDAPQKLIEMTLDNGGIIVNEIISNATANSTTLTLLPAGDGSDSAMLAKAQRLPVGTQVYDLQASFGTIPITLMKGSFTVEGDTSK